MEEIKNLVGISCEGYEEQFRALTTTIEASHPAQARSASKKDKELKKLGCMINYHSKEWNASRNKGKKRAVKGSL